jgi:hypothetical protein
MKERVVERDADGPKRGFWLMSLIIGASILIWLTLLGSAVAAWELHSQMSTAAHPSVPSKAGTGPENQYDPNARVTDEAGYRCFFRDTDFLNRCPDNPNFSGD